MRRKVIAFDLDGTLAPSKSALPDRMGELIAGLLDKYGICVISGGKFEQFEMQLLGNLHVAADKLERLHLMPTCGTRYMKHDAKTGEWRIVYAEDFTPREKAKIIQALTEGVHKFGYDKEKVYGDTIEDRDSQITWSALGQDIVKELGPEGVRLKEEWDTDNKKKQQVRDYVADLIPEFEVRVGGVTSVDITKLGIDKAYGMKKLMEQLGVDKKDILFIGDRLQEGGNDYPVKAMGIDTIEVKTWEDTVLAVEAILLAT